MNIVRPLHLCCAVPVLAAIVVAAACSSSSSTGPNTGQNVRILTRFDSLRGTTADGQRASEFQSIAQILAEGAPLGAGLIKNGAVTGRFTMVAALLVDDVNGQPVDSQYTVIGYEGNAPDSVVLFNASSSGVFSIVSDHDGSVGTIGGTVALTPDAPGAACKSFLAQAPTDLDAPVPITCRLQTVTASFVTAVGTSADTLSLPNQRVSGIRIETAAAPAAP